MMITRIWGRCCNQILACGTILTNKKDWDSKIMNLSKTSPHGASLEQYDPVNKILFGQWNDNKVVLFISSLGVSGKVMAKRRVGPDHVEVQIEEGLKRYTQDSFMGREGIDNVDKDKNWVDHSPEKHILRNATRWVCWAFLIS
jgi:hypothetical protein